jgi:hypothetical protein
MSRRFLEGADERLPWLAETKTILSLHIVGMELNLNGLPNDVIHVLGFSGSLSARSVAPVAEWFFTSQKGFCSEVLVSIYLWLYSPLLGLGCIFSFLIFYSRQDSLDGGSACHKAATCTHRTAQMQNKCTQTSMPQVGFKPTIPVFGQRQFMSEIAQPLWLAWSWYGMEKNTVIHKLQNNLPPKIVCTDWQATAKHIHYFHREVKPTGWCVKTYP